MKLEKAQIERLRGIPAGWPVVPIGEKGLIVYGPNGVGKSSIIDAIEATVADRSSLFQEARAGVNWEAASEHLKGGPPSVVLHGKISGKPVQLELGKQVASDLTSWVAAAKAASFVLRRYMLLQFINAQPKNRYEQIQPFLNLQHYANFENGLRQLVNSLDTSITIAATEMGTLAQTIRQTFNLAGFEDFDRTKLLNVLKAKLIATGSPASDEIISDLQALADTLDKELGGKEIGQRLGELSAAKHLAHKLTNTSLLLPLYEQVLAASDTLQTELSASAHKVPVSLLIAAKDHVHESMNSTCPICEQSVDPAALMERLAERISADEAVRLAAETLNERIAALRGAATTVSQTYASFTSAWSKLGLDALPKCYGAATSILERLIAVALKTAGNDRDDVRQGIEEAHCEPADEIARLDSEITAAGGGDRRTLLVEARSYVASLVAHLPKYEKLSAETRKLTKRKIIAEKLHNHAEEARKTAVQSMADRVATLANTYYEELHPGEKIATSKLQIRAATSGSMNLTTTFYGKEANPLLYYSESHLDTLGLCYFLAIRKLEADASPLFNLLLVDDVLHSVDAEHRVRLARLLHDHFGQMQMVLVTHDKYFYERLRAILGSGYKYLALSDWNIDSGPRLSDPSTDLDRVVDPTSRIGKSHEEIAAAGGRFFEWLLKGLTERLQISLQARFSREHDLGSMWPPCAKALNKQKGFVAKYPNLAKDLNDNGWVRNKIGAHDNESESAVTPAEVTEFVDKLAELYKAINCTDCGSFIQKSPTGAWRCDCSKLQYDNS